ncbi:hypothetical protein [Flammeovirga kamogawensis]|uniref:Tetratricopeptide repeat protein n=1 Tax=Flammeovirga kamogawensis TaxID=373891 RepID=A0ABX8GRG5_9BACT|nr:hypothetical protein [Flammeovirga kamogawensis]MBB6463803.1 tetratricopeptide (TPR) repeat protein [Flammeovirga kamogawensis]QWG06178.1 hypothetical protein KM029_12595 [Flammeovirga kamogawensis]TRX68009.1 hypothetical protein EO216_07615 [Flammeovirga kamogawensis]
MYSVREIYSLREEGKYQEAFITARSWLEISPNDEELQAAMAWVLYDMIKVANQEKNAEQFEELFGVFVEYIPLEADKLQLAACRILLIEIERLLNLKQFDKIDRLLLLIKPLQYHPEKERPKAFYQLLEIAVGNSQFLPNFLTFIRIWRLSNLQPQHYQSYGDSMSLAERVHWLVGQHLYEHKEENQEVIKAYIKQLDLLLERCPQFGYIRSLKEKLSIP